MTRSNWRWLGLRPMIWDTSLTNDKAEALLADALLENMGILLAATLDQKGKHYLVQNKDLLESKIKLFKKMYISLRATRKWERE